LIHNDFESILRDVDKNYAEPFGLKLRVVSSIRSMLSSVGSRRSAHFYGMAIDFMVQYTEQLYCDKNCLVDCYYDRQCRTSNIRDFVTKVKTTTTFQYAPLWNGVHDANHIGVSWSRRSSLDIYRIQRALYKACHQKCPLPLAISATDEACSPYLKVNCKIPSRLFVQSSKNSLHLSSSQLQEGNIQLESQFDSLIDWSSTTLSKILGSDQKADRIEFSDGSEIIEENENLIVPIEMKSSDASIFRSIFKINAQG